MHTGIRKKEILTGLTIISLGVCLFLAAELAFRVWSWSERGQLEVQTPKTRYFIDRETGLRLFRPNRQLGNIRVNNLGFRGPDLLGEKPERMFRLAFLGSSTTLDANTSEDGNWPHLVADRLRRVVEGCEVDYVNAGMPGYDLSDMAALYKYRVAATQPDLVIVMPGGLSRSLDRLAKQQGFEKNRRKLKTALTRYSYVIDKLVRWMQVASNYRSASTQSNKLLIDPQSLADLFKDDVQALLAVVSQEQNLVAVVSTSSKLSNTMTPDELARASPDVIYRLPFIHLPDLVALGKAYNRVIPEAVAGYRAIALVGLDDMPDKDRYFADRLHFTCAGSRLISKTIVEQLLSSEAVRLLLADRGCTA